MVQASLLSVQCVDVRWYTLAMKGKITLDLSYCQTCLEWFSIKEDGKSRSV